MRLGLHDTPLFVGGRTPSAFSERLYRRGRELIEVHGLRFAELVWDADEVLWDWAMSGTRLFGSLPIAIFGNFGHREWIAVRPGMLELLWGMRHASIELGHDPDMRIWTSGYPWRLWEIFRKVKGFRELLGAQSKAELGGAGALHPTTHPRVFTRPDYVAVVKGLLEREHREPLLSRFAEAARDTIHKQLDEKPHDSGFKIPEIAVLAGREAFAGAKILIDDAGRNVRWFLSAGRSAVHVQSVTPRIAFGAIPNSAWHPTRFLREVRSPVVLAIADALEALARDPTPRVIKAFLKPEAGPVNAAGPHAVEPVIIDIPSHVLWSQWIHPIRELEKAFKRLQKRRG